MKSYVFPISLLTAAISLIGLAGLVSAQTRDTAAMFGTVTDSQGALIPGATVTLTSANTQQLRSTKTSESGGYVPRSFQRRSLSNGERHRRVGWLRESRYFPRKVGRSPKIDRRQNMKYIATMALMFNLGVAGVY